MSNYDRIAAPFRPERSSTLRTVGKPDEAQRDLRAGRTTIDVTNTLLKAVPDHASLILVGDVDSCRRAPAKCWPIIIGSAPCRWCG